jgi:hypothetical protein
MKEKLRFLGMDVPELPAPPRIDWLAAGMINQSLAAYRAETAWHRSVGYMANAFTKAIRIVIPQDGRRKI